MGNSTEFLDGDEITFLLSLNQDCHILVIYQNARNEIYQLLPNRNHSTSFFRKGSFRPLPAPDAPFVFKAEPPFGKETIWVFAADVPLPKLDGENLKSGLRKLKQGIVLLRNKIHLHPKQAYGETSLILRTQPRN
ncbi:MAG: DUF4384 domain-containing protein [Gammaproteobacteria bacterium]|nr:DUF4384 domain-containing protein [Gammaproteobacteria bacterium]